MTADHALRSATDTQSSTIAGIVLICATFFFFSCLDATAKHLGQSLPVLQIVWCRFLGHCLIAVVLFRVWSRPHVLKPRHRLLQLLRGFLMLGATLFNFMAVQYLQLAETTAIMFATPFAVALLAGPMLGERAGLHRWLAIIVGFAGILIVARPGFGGMHWAALFSVAAMASYSFYTVFTRMLTPTDTLEGLLFFSAAVPAVVLAAPALAVWQAPPDAASWMFLMLTGVFGAFGHWLMIKAYAKAPAPVLAPFMYTQIVWMAGLGLVVFGDVPGIWTLVGLAIVISSGLYLFYRERRAAGRASD